MTKDDKIRIIEAFADYYVHYNSQAEEHARSGRFKSYSNNLGISARYYKLFQWSLKRWVT